MRREQVSVPLDAGLRAFVEKLAEEEDRTVAGQIRHLLAREQRKEQPPREHPRRAGEVGPPRTNPRRRSPSRKAA
jgi:hypothetical protein